MVITDHLIIYLQLLTGRVCACIRIDRTCTHRTIVVCTTYGDNPAFLSCSSSNSSMNSIKSTSISTSSCSPSPRATRPARAALQQLQPAGIRRCAEWRPTPTYRISTCRSRRGRLEAVLHVLRSPRDSNLTWNATSQQLWLLQLAAIVCCCERRGPNRPGI